MNRKTRALLLSAFVLPGLGHMYLGRRAKGLALFFAVNALLLAALFFVMKISSPILAAKITGTTINSASYLAELGAYGGWAKVLLAVFIGLWGFALVDLARSSDSAGES